MELAPSCERAPPTGRRENDDHDWVAPDDLLCVVLRCHVELSSAAVDHHHHHHHHRYHRRYLFAHLTLQTDATSCARGRHNMFTPAES